MHKILILLFILLLVGCAPSTPASVPILPNAPGLTRVPSPSVIATTSPNPLAQNLSDCSADELASLTLIILPFGMEFGDLVNRYEAFIRNPTTQILPDLVRDAESLQLQWNSEVVPTMPSCILGSDFRRNTVNSLDAFVNVLLLLQAGKMDEAAMYVAELNMLSQEYDTLVQSLTLSVEMETLPTPSP
jgi:hypothetical protein